MKSLGLASVKSSATLFIHRISLNRKNLHLFYLNFCIFLKYNMKNQTHNYRGFIKGSIWSVFGTAALLSLKSQSESAKYSMGYNKAIFNQQQLWTYSKWVSDGERERELSERGEGYFVPSAVSSSEGAVDHNENYQWRESTELLTFTSKLQLDRKRVSLW